MLGNPTKFLLLVACFGCSNAVAEDSDASLRSAAIECIDKELADVELAIENLNEATDFLVQRVCSIEAVRLEQFRNIDYRRRLDAEIEEVCGPEQKFWEINDPIDLDETQTDEDHFERMNCRMDLEMGSNRALLGATPAINELTAYASAKLLKLRSARLGEERAGDE